MLEKRFGQTAEFPVIVHNGAFILDSVTQEILLENYFKAEETCTKRR